MIREQELVFDEAISDAEQRADEALDTLEDITPDNPEWDGLEATAEQAIADARILRWMRDDAHTDNGVDVWGRPATSITLGGLSAGEMAHVRSELPDGATAADAEAYIVARATVSAPYHDPDKSLDDQMVDVAALPAEVVSYLERQVTDLMQVGEGNGQRSERLRKARESATSTGD